ncbi:MAG: CpaF family protein, partial [Deltaproteobacteria bacterium]|nr:CpaF family protein [Deltaproteobacteria bacterium]
ARFLDVCVYLGKNILVSGGTGSGKTTLLNILGTRVPSQQRLVIIEDASELKVHIDHVVYFETKSSDAMGKGEVTTRDLMRAALRLRPDRIILGEVRSEEAMDLITAMNTGHNGSMGTIHANSPFDSLVRLETLAMIGETRVPVVAVRRQIVSAIHIVVQIQRMSDGTRKITNVSEVLPEIDDHGHYFLKSIYKFIQKGKTPEGKVVGELIPTGHIPGMIVEMEINQIPFPKDKFTPPDWYVETQKKAA